MNFDKLGTAYMVLAFYSVLMAVAANIGYNMDKKNGFTNGYIVGIVISLVLWFTMGKKYAKV